MEKIVDEFLEYAERNPGRTIAWILGIAAIILVSYWVTAGYFGPWARVIYGLAVVLGAIIFVSRHMSHRETTDDFKATQTREEMAIADALHKFKAGEPLTVEDIAALRMRREGGIM